MTLRDLSAKDVIQLKTGENLGRIDDVVFDGIYVLSGDDSIDFIEGNLCPINIEGYNEEFPVTNITVKNLFVEGTPITDDNVRDNPSTSIDRNTENVHFVNDSPLPEAIAALAG